MTHGTRRNVAARDLSGQGGKSKRFARNNRIDSSTPWAAGATEDSLLGENKKFNLKSYSKCQQLAARQNCEIFVIITNGSSCEIVNCQSLFFYICNLIFYFTGKTNSTNKNHHHA